MKSLQITLIKQAASIQTLLHIFDIDNKLTVRLFLAENHTFEGAGAACDGKVAMPACGLRVARAVIEESVKLQVLSKEITQIVYQSP